MKNQRQISKKRPTNGAEKQRKTTTRSTAKRRKAESALPASPTRRLLRDAAAEQERKSRVLRASIRRKVEWLERHAPEEDLQRVTRWIGALADVLRATKRGARDEEAEMVVITEAIGAARELPRRKSDAVLRSVALSVGEPARTALLKAITAPNRDDRLAFIEIGGFRASLGECDIKTELGVQGR